MQSRLNSRWRDGMNPRETVASAVHCPHAPHMMAVCRAEHLTHGLYLARLIRNRSVQESYNGPKIRLPEYNSNDQVHSAVTTSRGCCRDVTRAFPLMRDDQRDISCDGPAILSDRDAVLSKTTSRDCVRTRTGNDTPPQGCKQSLASRCHSPSPLLWVTLTAGTKTNIPVSMTLLPHPYLPGEYQPIAYVAAAHIRHGPSPQRLRSETLCLPAQRDRSRGVRRYSTQTNATSF
jgi:hypothetical protein